MEVKISEFNSRFLDQLNNLPPKEWQSNAYKLFIHNEWQPWFFPYQAVIDSKLVGFGMAFIFNEFAWLGWILVHKKHRNKGIGKEITKFIISESRKKGVENFILTATDMGLPIYTKLGFEIKTNYKFLNPPEKIITAINKEDIRLAVKNDLPTIFQIDSLATGENRKPLIESYIDEIWIHINSQIDGFFIPSLGNGFIAATDPKAGIALLDLKLKKGKTSIVVPENNITAIEFLLSKGFTEGVIVPRLGLGKEPSWNPEMIFNRAAGYCG